MTANEFKERKRVRKIYNKYLAEGSNWTEIEWWILSGVDMGRGTLTLENPKKKERLVEDERPS